MLRGLLINNEVEIEDQVRGKNIYKRLRPRKVNTNANNIKWTGKKRESIRKLILWARLV